MTTSDNKVLILSPHLDDAVFSVGGTIATRAADVFIMTFFAGKPVLPVQSWWDRLCGFRDSDQAITTRLQEDATAFSILGVAPNQLWYGAHEDIQYRQTKHVNTVAHKETIKQQLMFDIERYIAITQPSSVYFPLMRLHPDHALLSQAAVSVFKTGKYPHITFYGYEDLPYTYFFHVKHPFLSWDGRFANRAIEDNTIQCEPVGVSLSLEQWNKKIHAIQAYKTQFIGMKALLLWVVRRVSRRNAGINDLQEILYRLSTHS